MTALGRSVLVVNDSIIAKELFDKRAKNYSHRPQTIMAGELIGLNKVCKPPLSLCKDKINQLHRAWPCQIMMRSTSYFVNSHNRRSPPIT